MNKIYNEKTHTTIEQLFNKVSAEEPGCAYIASFDNGVTYKGSVGLALIEESLAITTKTFLILLQLRNNSQHFLFYS